MSLDQILDDTNANNARVSTFFLKGSDGNISGFVEHTVSVTTTQFCSCSTKAAINNT